jgi:nicotinamidase-related amidase
MTHDRHLAASGWRFSADERAPLAELVVPAHTALLVVDMQKLFTGMPLEPDLAGLLPRLQRVIEAARAAGVPCVFLRHIIEEAQWSEQWQQQHTQRIKAALAPDSPVVAFDEAFEPRLGDLSVIKPRYSGFIGTDLEQQLRARGVATVVVAGLTTDVCVSSTVRDAFQRDFHTVTLSDCTAEQTVARHDASLQTIASCFGRVSTSADVLAAWQARPAHAIA